MRREPQAEPLRAVANGAPAQTSPAEPAPSALRPAALAERPAVEPPAPALRTRLRLAPTAEDAEMRALFEAPAAAEPAPVASRGGDGWSWKDLLGGMEAEAEAGTLDEDALADRLLAEIAGMGVDPAALLPRSRIDDIARAFASGEAAPAREAVRRLAPAAVRRLARRVATDRALRGEADVYRRRYAQLIRQATRDDDDAETVSALLGSDPGRAFLLLDAASGELA